MKTGLSKIKKEIAFIESDIHSKSVDLQQNRALLKEQLKSTQVIFSALIGSFTLGFLITPSRNRLLHSQKYKQMTSEQASTRKTLTKLDIASIITSLVGYLRLFK